MDDYQKYKFLRNNNYVKLYSTSNHHCNPLVCAWERTSANKYPIGPWKLSSYVVHFIIEGEGVCTYKNKKIEIPAGSIFTVTPIDTVAYMQKPSNPWRSIWFQISGRDCASLFENSGINENVFIRKVNDYEKFKYLFLDMMNDCYTQNDDNGFLFLSNMYKIFNAISEEFYSHKIHRTTNNQLFEEIINYIDKNFCNNISPGIIAEKFFISTQYLDRFFKNEMKTTPSTYITNLRLDKAAIMLTHENFSISSIAESTGFTNPYYFSNVFKKKYVVSPAKYRYQSKHPEK